MPREVLVEARAVDGDLQVAWAVGDEDVQHRGLVAAARHAIRDVPPVR